VAAFCPCAPSVWWDFRTLFKAQRQAGDSTDVVSYRVFRRASHHDAFFSPVLPSIMTISLTVLQIIGRLKIDEMMRGK
jgi:hypothetical protein